MAADAGCQGFSSACVYASRFGSVLSSHVLIESASGARWNAGMVGSRDCKFPRQYLEWLVRRDCGADVELTMGDSEKWATQCPCCEAKLLIDRKTGTVIWSEEKPAKPSASLNEMVQRLDDQRRAANQRVEQEQRALKDRSRVLEEKVKELMKWVDPDAKPPPRPFDFD